MRYFSSSISGKRVSDFQNYDASISNFSDRMMFVDEMIKDENGLIHDFFIDYFGIYYKSNPSQNDYLAEEDSVCRLIEGLGTYLLNSKDIESHRKIKYRFWKNEREFMKYKESKNINESTIKASLESEEDDIEVFDYFYSNEDKNFRKVGNMKVYKKDIKEIDEIGSLQELIDRASNGTLAKSIEKRIDEIIDSIEDERDLGRLKSIRANIEKYVNTWAREAKDNQMLIKTVIKKPIELKSKFLNGKADSFDDFDFMDKNHIKAVLPFLSKSDLFDDIGMVIYDVNNLLDETPLSGKEKEVINLFRDGYRRHEIPKVLKVKSETINKMMNRISFKAVKTYEKKVARSRELVRSKKI